MNSRVAIASLLMFVTVSLGGCSGLVRYDTRDSGPSASLNIPLRSDAVPRNEPQSRSGNSPTYVVNGQSYSVMASANGYRERGVASWYGRKFHGRKTASGERYDMYAMTAAHRTLPLPTYVRVTNLSNGRSTIVRVNDRGPFVKNRLIDLSYNAARKLGIVANGTGLVEVTVISPGEPLTPIITATPATPGTPSGFSTPIPRMYLQVGAFISRRNAEGLLEQLREAMTHPIQIQQGSGQAQTLYRVRIGPLANVELADTLAEQLSSHGMEDSKIVIE